jgi:serine/threonine-protein kinase
MATVHVGRLRGEGGFGRTVAIKRLHPQFVHDPEFVEMFLDEARLVARIRHPNVVPTLDVVAAENELFLVMELILGESLAKLLRLARKSSSLVPLPITSGILTGALYGLHAAHEARDEHGEPLGLVHRDVTPHNILVGTDGAPRLIDFGVAKSFGQMHMTREGQIKGKIAYMSPEQIRSSGVDRRSDVYAAGVVLWETLTGRKLFQSEDDVSSVVMALDGVKVKPSALNPALPSGLDDVVMKALASDPAERFATAKEMALALEQVAPCASPHAIGAWVEELARVEVEKRQQVIAQLERSDAFEPAPRLSTISPLRRPSTPPPPDPPAPPAPEPPPQALAASVEHLAPPIASPEAVPGEESQMSALGITSEPQPGRTPPARRWLPLALVAALGALLLVGWFNRTPGEAGAASTAASSAPSAPPAIAPPPVTASTSAAPPEAAPPATASASASAASPAASAAPRKPPKNSDNNCANPYKKGPDGILRIKPGCL